MIGLIITALVLIGLGYYFYYREIKIPQTTRSYYETLRNNTKEKAFQVIEQHKKQLGFQRKKVAYTDDYGTEILTKWQDIEIPHFIRNNICTALNNEEHSYLYDPEGPMDEIRERIEIVAKKERVNIYGFHEQMNGFEFEVFCADKLKIEGWIVRKTKDGADQGVDLIISKNNRKIAVQCKKYSRPVGNKAVQEVKTGIAHYGLVEGIVISNNDFTKSAIELANTNDIKLLHFLDTGKI